MESIQFTAVLSQAKKEILHDIEIGVIPKKITSFSELHDFVDANWYGGFCAEGYENTENFEFENSIQNALDSWIKSEEFNNLKN